MKNDYSSATLLAVTLQLHHFHGGQADEFVGPGVVECVQGKCEFSVQTGFGCSDPCHTHRTNHMYGWSFEDLADVSVDPSNDNGVGKPCFYRRARNIDAYFPDQYVSIEEGCTAQCTDCTFAPTEIHSGPGRLNCDNGRCTDYTTEEFNCGRKIERASESWGSLQTLFHGEDTVHSFHGFEGINTVRPAYIPNGCTLECSGCDFEGIRRDRQRNLRSNHPE